MEKIEAVTEDHSRVPVPEVQKVSGFKIALVITNIVVSVPVLLLGIQIAAGTGLEGALTAFFIGGAILTVMGAITAIVGAKANLSTYMIIQFPFGQRGGKLVNIILLTTLLGWYAVTAAVFGGALGNAFKIITGIAVNTELCTLIGSSLMILVIIFGFRSLNRLAGLAVPLLLALMAAMVFNALSRHGLTFSGSGSHGMGAGKAISVVIGGYAVGIVLMPDLTRYAKSAGHSVLASTLSLLIGLPVILSASAIVGSFAGKQDLVELIFILGPGVSGLIILTFVSWTNNAINLYSSSLSLAAIIPGISKWRFVILAGAVGTALALTPIVQYFIPFLLAIGILLPPLAGIYISDFFIRRKQRFDLTDLGSVSRVDYPAMIIWLLAAGVGFLTSSEHFQLTTIPGLDAMLVAFLLHAAAGILVARYKFQILPN